MPMASWTNAHGPDAYQPWFSFTDTNRRPGIKTPLDLDELQLPYIQSVPQIVMRRSPTVTRPPANYRRTFIGKYYELWERVAGTEGSVRAHLPLGPNVFQPGARPDCRVVRAMATRARRIGGALAYVRRPEVIVTSPMVHSLAWHGYGAYPRALVPVSAGAFRSEVSSKTGGRHSVWIEGSFGREVRVLVNGRDVGSVSNETGNPGQYFRIGSIDLRAGPSSIRVVQTGGDARPGNGGWDSSLRHIGPVALSAEANDRREVEWMKPEQARELCSQRLDWIEVVERGGSL